MLSIYVLCLYMLLLIIYTICNFNSDLLSKNTDKVLKIVIAKGIFCNCVTKMVIRKGTPMVYKAFVKISNSANDLAS